MLGKKQQVSLKGERRTHVGMTMTQKILADHAGLDSVKAGELIMADIDIVLANDVTAPLAIREFEKLGRKHVFDRTKVVLVPDHFAPNKDIKAAEQCKSMREFALEQGIENYYEVGKMGIEHVLLPEKGIVVPGQVIIGADSHTCTYGALGAFSTGVGSTDAAVGMVSGKCWFKVPPALKFVLAGELSGYVRGKDVILHIIGKIGVDGARYKSMEFAGGGVGNLGMDSRFSIANMAIEAGAKNAIFPVDKTTLAYIRAHSQKQYKIYEADKDAEYDELIEIDLGSVPLTVSLPNSPANTRSVDELGEVIIDQVIIGSCTNGRIEDLRLAAALLKGKKVSPRVRLIIIPGTQEIYLQAIREGLVEIFIESGAAVSTPTCGPCLGGHMGVLAKGERALATTNRNFVGRMGHPQSEVFLAGPAVAAASAIAGKITNPETIERYRELTKKETLSGREQELRRS